MEKLWSPWRSQYIASFKEKKTSSNCVLCDISNQDVEDPQSLLVYKDKLTFIVLNLYPYNNGHLMVVPYRHTSDFLTLTPEENSEIMKNLQKCEKALRSCMNPEGFNVGANIGKAAGAGIDDHIHFHIVPRWNGDTNFMPALGEVKVISQDLLANKQSLTGTFKVLE